MATFKLNGVADHRRARSYRARKLIVATGYYDHANYLSIPVKTAESFALLHRSASVLRPQVAIIGAGNSAADTRGNSFRARA